MKSSMCSSIREKKTCTVIRTWSCCLNRDTHVLFRVSSIYCVGFYKQETTTMWTEAWFILAVVLVALTVLTVWKSNVVEHQIQVFRKKLDKIGR